MPQLSGCRRLTPEHGTQAKPNQQKGLAMMPDVHASCPACGALRPVPAGQPFPNHPDLSYAARGVLRWCAYSHGVMVPITGIEA